MIDRPLEHNYDAKSGSGQPAHPIAIGAKESFGCAPGFGRGLLEKINRALAVTSSQHTASKKDGRLLGLLKREVKVFKREHEQSRVGENITISSPITASPSGFPVTPVQ